MPPHRHHASFLLCVAVVSAALLCGCGATAATTTTSPTCVQSAGSWAYADTVAQLKQKAQVIVVGTVVSTQAGGNAPCAIHADATVRVDRTVYDPRQQVRGTTLVVRTQGGQLASGYGLLMEDEAKLGAGDQLVLFLAQDTAATYRVVDGDQGAIHITGGMVQPVASRSEMPMNTYIDQIEQA